MGMVSNDTRIWVADMEPSTRYPLYTRGNTGEVFPNVITALTGTPLQNLRLLQLMQVQRIRGQPIRVLLIKARPTRVR